LSFKEEKEMIQFYRFMNLEFGIYEDGFGICYKDKYCYTSYYGFEILS